MIGIECGHQEQILSFRFAARFNRLEVFFPTPILKWSPWKQECFLGFHRVFPVFSNNQFA